MKYLLMLFFSINFYHSAFAGGGQEGGGGGVVHDSFIQYGKEVLYYLKNTPNGKEVVKNRGLDLCRLKSTLNENLIFVYDNDEMIDHRGSIVDAYTYQWAIYLDNKTWKNYIKDKTNIYHLVFKEMLRSEGSYFYDAINISLDLKNISNSDFIIPQREATRFNLWYEKAPMCLTEQDVEQIENNLNSHMLLTNHDAPRCELIEKNSKHEFLANTLIETSKKTKCIPTPSQCHIQTIQTKGSKLTVLEKAIFWKGKKIYNLPIAMKDNQTNEKVYQYPFMDILDDSINFMLSDLYYAQICQNKPKSSIELPQFLTIKTDEYFSDILDFEYIRPKESLGCVSCVKKGLKAVGLGSKVKLMSEQIITASGFGAKFIKVKVIENNNLPHRLKDSAANIGQEGWVTLSSTNLLFYYNQDFDLLNSRN